jgi:di/tricarboxylate transporter
VPTAIVAAEALGVSPYRFAVAVLIAASTDFAYWFASYGMPDLILP